MGWVAKVKGPGRQASGSPRECSIRSGQGEEGENAGAGVEENGVGREMGTTYSARLLGTWGSGKLGSLRYINF